MTIIKNAAIIYWNNISSSNYLNYSKLLNNYDETINIINKDLFILILTHQGMKL